MSPPPPDICRRHSYICYVWLGEELHCQMTYRIPRLALCSHTAFDAAWNSVFKFNILLNTMEARQVRDWQHRLHRLCRQQGVVGMTVLRWAPVDIKWTFGFHISQSVLWQVARQLASAERDLLRRIRYDTFRVRSSQQEYRLYTADDASRNTNMTEKLPHGHGDTVLRASPNKERTIHKLWRESRVGTDYTETGLNENKTHSIESSAHTHT
jgi:hypothetical protein